MGAFMHQRYSSLLIIVVLVLASLFPLITANRYTAFLSDDSYISLAYAKNIVNGRGFVFNYPPAVLGTTTPLFTMAVAGLALIFPQMTIHHIAVFLTAFCWIGIVWVIFFFHKEWELDQWQAAIVGLVVISSGWIGFLGMESYPFAFLLVLCLSLFLSRHFLSTGLMAGLLFLTRGEGILILILIFITVLIQLWHKSKSIDHQWAQTLLNLSLGFVIPVFIWFVYAHLTFGSFLPNTLAAKQAQAQSGLWCNFSERLTNDWIPLWGKSFLMKGMPLINFWWIITLIGVIVALFQKRRWLIFIGWIILYISGYILFNVSAYPWYQLPILFILNLFFGLGIIKIVDILRRHIKSLILSFSVSVFVTTLLLFALAQPTVTTMLTYQGEAKGKSYTALSQWFREHTENSNSIAFIEIGYLGYYTDNRIIDLAGLTLPDILPHIAKGDFAWGFWHYQPDYYVYLSDFDWALASIRADSRFDQQYQCVATLPGPRENDFIIYKRVRR
jgi:arabinofuranosyltransferase